MIAIAVLLALIAGITVGYAARQRQELGEAQDKIDHLLLENEHLRGENRAHVSCLEMMLREVDVSL